MDHKDLLDSFLELSAALTGYDTSTLTGTGQAGLYLATACERAGEDNVAAMLTASHGAIAGAGTDEAARDSALRHAVLGEPCFGPLARNLIKMWFTGCWREMPSSWREAFGGGRYDSDIIPSPASYTEGLLWPTVGANPPGAKPFGYAMWATPPRVTLD